MMRGDIDYIKVCKKFEEFEAFWEDYFQGCMENNFAFYINIKIKDLKKDLERQSSLRT